MSRSSGRFSAKGRRKVTRKAFRFRFSRKLLVIGKLRDELEYGAQESRGAWRAPRRAHDRTLSAVDRALTLLLVT